MVFHIPYIRYDNYVSTVLETFLNLLLLIPMSEVQKKRQKKALINVSSTKIKNACALL
jgi:hypothetical protein